MNVLITGGAGYVGTELVYALEQEPDVRQVVVYDNLSRRNYNLLIGHAKLQRDKVRFVQGDILDSRKLKAEVEAADIIYHLAAKVTTPFADHNPHEFDQVNNWGTAELTYLVEQSNVSKLIYASSVSVYGASREEAGLDKVLNPRTFYGISKMHAEEYVTRLSGSNTSVYVLRMGNVYGYSKSMRFDSVINKFIFEANFANRLRIYGDGNQARSFFQVDRLSQLLKEVALGRYQPGTYNLVENSYSINEIVDVLKALYPTTEMVYVNQNMKMRSLVVQRDPRIPTPALEAKDQLTHDLQDFRSRFSF